MVDVNSILRQLLQGVQDSRRTFEDRQSSTSFIVVIIMIIGQAVIITDYTQGEGDLIIYK